MAQEMVLRRLRPYLFSAIKQHRVQRLSCAYTAASVFPPPVSSPDSDEPRIRDYQKRVKHLETYKPLTQCYPRIDAARDHPRLQKDDFENRYKALALNESEPDETVTLAGRVRSVRTAGSKLCFVDIEVENGATIQAVCQSNRLAETDVDVSATEQFKTFCRLVRRGDSYSFRGIPHRTARGELSVLASQIPSLLSPSLHQIPDVLENAEARARSRHVDMLVNPAAIQTLELRHTIEQSMQDFFNRQGFVKVNTPLLSNKPGGAAARPFETTAHEFTDETISLRIAPELWLKRLIVGGMEKVYEIGPAFRNEGIDHTHNPEFTICEFYEAYATLDQLMSATQNLLSEISSSIEASRTHHNKFTALPRLDIDFTTPIRQIEFIPGLEAALHQPLPDLASPTARDDLLSIFTHHDLPTPSPPTLPRLLDALAATHLEPLSATAPLFITHHPAAMSPLSKHFTCPRTGQTVAARAELFARGRELANMYEEENSPFEQRAKFEAQRRRRQQQRQGRSADEEEEEDDDPDAMPVDEAYLRALEWGMPPTGGWGCGVDRLVMMFGGRERIADVLAFGTLRNVVRLGSENRKG